MIALSIGCAGASVGGHSRASDWDAYCCIGGDVTSPLGCRGLEGEAEACTETGALAIECQPTTGCIGGNTGCFCCREIGTAQCHRSMRTARAKPPPEDACPPAETESELELEPAPQHRRSGRVWSSF